MGLRSIFLWREAEAGEWRVGSLQLKPDQGRCCRQDHFLKSALQGPSYFSSPSSPAKITAVCREEGGMAHEAVGSQAGEVHGQDWEQLPASCSLVFCLPGCPSALPHCHQHLGVQPLPAKWTGKYQSSKFKFPHSACSTQFSRDLLGFPLKSEGPS